MKFQELNEWALATANKTNPELLDLGVKTEKLSKVRNMLKEGISVRCKLIITNTEKNNKYTGEIEDFIKQLTNFGLNPTKSIEEKNKYNGEK